MTVHLRHRDQPCSWVQLRPHRDASLRFKMHGKVQPMDYGRPGFFARLFGRGQP